MAKSNGSRWPRRLERGGVAAIVAILLGTGVLLGLAALSVDVGNIMWERRQLQNGADATSMKLAAECAADITACDDDQQAASLTSLASANGYRSASDATAQLDRSVYPEGQCGRVPGAPDMPACTTTGDITDLAQCPELPTWLTVGAGANVPYVETYTLTSDAGGSTLTPFFGQSAARVSACARAGWGQPGAGSATTPITISVCEWQTYTNGGSNWVVTGPEGAWPGYGGTGQPAYPPAATSPNTPGHELVITLHDPSKPPCSFNGKDTAGGFGYLDPTSNCSATVTITQSGDQWANIDTGSSATVDCQTYLAQLYANGPTIDIPVFDCVVRNIGGTPTGGIAGKDCTGAGGGGAQTYYHILGWAKFYLSGYKIGGGPATERPSRVTSVVPCSGSVRCLSGWFVKGTLATASTIVPPTPGVDLGSYAVIPLG